MCEGSDVHTAQLTMQIQEVTHVHCVSTIHIVAHQSRVPVLCGGRRAIHMHSRHL